MKQLIKYYLFGLLLMTTAVHSFSQVSDLELANYYYNEGDCDKALPYLQSAYKTRPDAIVFAKYLSCLQEQNDEKEAIKLIKKQISTYPRNSEYGVLLGQEYERQNDASRAEKAFQALIDNLTPSPNGIINLYSAFTKTAKFDWALKVLERGDQLMNKNYPFNLQFAEVYGALDRIDEMIEQYIDLLDHNPRMLSSLKIIIPRTINFEEDNNDRFKLFQNALIKKIQKQPNDHIYSELLIWALLQRRNYGAALIQAKSLDKKTGNTGSEVMVIGTQAVQDRDYATGRNAFQYVLSLGKDKSYYYMAEQSLLNTRYLEITTVRNYTQEQIAETLLEYEQVLERLPKNGKVLPIIREKAMIQAYYGNQSEEAIKSLQEALSFPKYDALETAKTKVLLSDIMVLEGNVWDAALYYMQVEKEFKYEPIGEEAKYKNARLFYYDGDFKFAQSQLDILKQATSRLIANDAMNLSSLITDNLGLDSNYNAMRKFAKADLLLEQHRYKEAFLLYDSITKIYPYHNLSDDILMRKAEAYQFQGKWEEAIENLEEIVEKFGDDILADDALYQLAQIYENHLFDKQKASEYYFKLMRDYPGSLFVTEARKAYREIN